MAVAVAVSDRWQVTCETRHATCDTWHMTPEMWHMKRDTWKIIFFFFFWVPFCLFLSVLVLVQLSAHIKRFSVSCKWNIFFVFLLKFCGPRLYQSKNVSLKIIFIFQRRQILLKYIVYLHVWDLLAVGWERPKIQFVWGISMSRISSKTQKRLIKIIKFILRWK